MVVAPVLALGNVSGARRKVARWRNADKRRLLEDSILGTRTSLRDMTPCHHYMTWGVIPSILHFCESRSTVRTARDDALRWCGPMQVHR
jgi:hypothetical protein